MERNLLVIGATGKTGGHTTELLLQRGHRVRALVRGLDGRAERLAALGADIVEGDVLDLDSRAQAAKGTDALYFTYPIRPGLMDATAKRGPGGGGERGPGDREHVAGLRPP
ncbi:SDR family oxidoreductase [Streptomyces mirabilis]|uniref:SDR family oxidoreductase n=1 Tax=Streptomyces mirabilis TaxID=68239 RepID=UPI0036DA55F5